MSKLPKNPPAGSSSWFDLFTNILATAKSERKPLKDSDTVSIKYPDPSVSFCINNKTIDSMDDVKTFIVECTINDIKVKAFDELMDCLPTHAEFQKIEQYLSSYYFSVPMPRIVDKYNGFKGLLCLSHH